MPYSDFTHQDYSHQDFMRLIEHRVRKDLRLHDSISTKKSYKLVDDGTLSTRVLLQLLERIFRGRLDLNGEEEIDSSCLEQYIVSRLDVFLKGEDSALLKEKKIMPLRSVTSNEIIELGKLFGIQGSHTVPENSIVDDLQGKYKQAKASFLKSFLHIEEM